MKLGVDAPAVSQASEQCTFDEVFLWHYITVWIAIGLIETQNESNSWRRDSMDCLEIIYSVSDVT